MQVLYYGSHSLALLALGLIFGVEANVNDLLSWKSIRFSSPHNWMAVLAAACAAAASGYWISIVVERVKKVVDFTSTLYLLHLATAAVYDLSFPTSWEWWLVTVLCMVGTAWLGDTLCIENEMQDISVQDIMEQRNGSLEGDSGTSGAAAGRKRGGDCEHGTVTTMNSALGNRHAGATAAAVLRDIDEGSPFLHRGSAYGGRRARSGERGRARDRLPSITQPPLAAAVMLARGFSGAAGSAGTVGG